MRIRRRIYDKGKGTVKVKTEIVTLITKRKKTVVVKLANGDVIKRKIKDVVEWDKKKVKI